MINLLAFLPGLSAPLLFWLLPICWCLHTIEEILMIDRWEMGREVEHRVIAEKSILARWLLNMYSISRGPFTLASVVIGLLIVGATVAGTMDMNGAGSWLYAIALGGFFLHGFLHIGESIVLRGYTPGILSGMFVVLPGSWYIYNQLFSASLLDLKVAMITSVLGVVVFVPLAIGIRLLLKFLFTARS